MKSIPRMHAIVLGALFLWIGGTRLFTYHEPMERDLATYAVIGHELLGPRLLYTDLWDHKPPAIHVTLMLAQRLFGYGPFSIYLLNIAVTFVTTLGLYFLGRLRGGGNQGLWMAAFWTVLSGDCRLQANQPNCEMFMNACLVWVFYLLMRDESPSTKIAVWVGLLIGIGSLYKHVLFFPAGLLLAMFALAPGQTETKTARLKFVALAGAVAAGLWVFTAAYFQSKGRFHDFWFAVFSSNSQYMGLSSAATENHFSLLERLLSPLTLHTGLAILLVPMTFLVTLFLASRWANQEPLGRWLLLAGYFWGVWVAIALPGYLYLHYFQLALPAIAIAIPWSIQEIDRRNDGTSLRIAGLTNTALLVILVGYQLSFLQLSSDEWSKKKYHGNFISAKNLAGQITHLLQPSETFYNYGNDPELYYYTKRTPPTGILMGDAFMRQGLASVFAARIIGDLEKNTPELIAVSNWDFPDQIFKNPVGEWIQARYVPLSIGKDAYFSLMAQKGGRLDKQGNQQKS